jgi:hypothetical protein
MGESINAYFFFRKNWKDDTTCKPRAAGSIILKFIAGDRVGLWGLSLFDSALRPVAWSCEHGNESLGFIKREERLDELSDYTFTIRDTSVYFFLILYKDT